MNLDEFKDFRDNKTIYHKNALFRELVVSKMRAGLLAQGAPGAEQSDRCCHENTQTNGYNDDL